MPGEPRRMAVGSGRAAVRDVRSGEAPRATLSNVRRREPAEHADEQEGAGFRSQREPVLRRADNRTERDTADQVDDEGAERKERAGRAQHERGQEVARDDPTAPPIAMRRRFT